MRELAIDLFMKSITKKKPVHRTSKLTLPAASPSAVAVNFSVAGCAPAWITAMQRPWKLFR